jgi:hypothetical protein
MLIFLLPIILSLRGEVHAGFVLVRWCCKRKLFSKAAVSNNRLNYSGSVGIIKKLAHHNLAKQADRVQ